MIKIINYGVGNLQAFLNAYKRLNIPVQLIETPDQLKDAHHIILPGVGSFDHAMKLFNKSGLREPLSALVAQGNTFVLGICVGMQMLADTSDEGILPGLGWVKGRVRRFHSHPEASLLPMPHMGWNDVEIRSGQGLFNGLEDNARFYFLHSYYQECKNRENSLATADYGFKFDCAVQNDNVYGVQFHPEKSHRWGLTLLKNFADF